MWTTSSYAKVTSIELADDNIYVQASHKPTISKFYPNACIEKVPSKSTCSASVLKQSVV